MTFKTQKKPAGTQNKPQAVPRATSTPAKTTPTAPAKTPQLKPRASTPPGTSRNSTTGTRQTTTPVDPAKRGKISLPPIKDPKTRADAQLITRVLDTQPKFAQLIANQAANGLLSGKQVNDLAALAKRMQVKGKNDPQVVKELAKAMNGMNPSMSEVFWKEFARGMKEDTGKNLKQFGLGAAEAGKQNLLGLLNAVRHPVTTAKGIGQMVAQEQVRGIGRNVLGAQAVGLLPGNKKAAQARLQNQLNGAGQYVNGIAADPRKIGAVTANAMGAVLPVPGGKVAASLATKAGTTAAGKAALGVLEAATLKVGAIADIGKGLKGKITKIVTGKDGKQYAFVQTNVGQKKVLAESIKLARGVNQPASRTVGVPRTPASSILTPEQISQITREFRELGGDPKMLEFNRGRGTGYIDQLDIINVRGDVLPTTLEAVIHPRSIMSSRAVLAHELGHQAHRGTKLPPGAWNDEFRASYWAAKNAKGLTAEERLHLIQDAVERAREAGIPIKSNRFMREILYGY